LICRRLLSGLYEEIGHPRRQLIDNLRSVLGCFAAQWREPIPKVADLFRHELGLERELSVRHMAARKSVLAAHEKRLAALEASDQKVEDAARVLIDALKAEIGLPAMSIALRLDIERLEEVLGPTSIGHNAQTQHERTGQRQCPEAPL
jgi:hypothetical protein